MSITSLVDDEIKRTERPILLQRSKDLLHQRATDLSPRHKIEKTIASNFAIDLAYADLPERGTPHIALSPTDDQTTNALNALIKYIPTEVVTLYVAAVAATPALKATFSFVNEGRLYWLFVATTPLLVLIILAGRRKSRRLKALPPVRSWPWWKLIAATFAFLVWALAVPNNPYVGGPLQSAVAGFAAVFVSTFLCLLEPIFERPPRKGK